MNSPFFVAGKTDDAETSSGRTQPPQSGDDPFSGDRNGKTFGVSVFDLPQLDWNKGGKSLADAEDPGSESPYDILDELDRLCGRQHRRSGAGGMLFDRQRARGIRAELRNRLKFPPVNEGQGKIREGGWGHRGGG
jgi:hypothetical protein